MVGHHGRNRPDPAPGSPKPAARGGFTIVDKARTLLIATGIQKGRPAESGVPRFIISMHHITSALQEFDANLPEVSVLADRLKIAKRLWRATADDGEDLGFEVAAPLKSGDVVWQSPTARYVIRQAAEPLLEIPLDPKPEEAAITGWAVGNMHFVIEAQPTRLLAEDDPTLRQALERFGIHYHEIVDVFQPHRFAASAAGHGHGHSHNHDHSHDHGHAHHHH
jgi:urease accessory protein